MNHMYKNHCYKFLVITFLLTTFFTASAQKKKSEPIASKPKLVVGIVVDQMKVEYLFRYAQKFGNNGFKRLLNEGFFCENTNYNYVPTFTGPGHACVYTGATPSSNGIIANDWFQRNTNDTMYCTDDHLVNSVGTNSDAGKMSPKNLLTTTITDELRISNNFKSKVIGIALKDRGAILPAGQSANAAYWFDGSNGNWITSSYYMNELPAWVNNFNALKFPEKYLSEQWKTLLPIEQYTESTADDNAYEESFKGESKPIFPHDIPTLKGKNFDILRKIPSGNTFTKDFAIAALKAENMGKGTVTDFLAVSFSSTDYVGHQFGTNAIETEDTYLRLDNDIADLLKFLDETYGKNNVLVFLTADHGAIQNVTYLHDHKIAAKTFNSKSIADILSVQLKNKFGEEALVSSVINDQVYLNHTLIADKKLNLEEVQKTTASLLLELDGVANTLTATQFSTIQFTEGICSKIQHGFYKKRSGDVMIILEPGLVEYKKTGTTHGSGNNYDTHVPLIWYGWNIPNGKTAKPFNVVDIAATLAAMLHIEFPSGCTGKPIEELVK